MSETQVEPRGGGPGSTKGVPVPSWQHQTRCGIFPDMDPAVPANIPFTYEIYAALPSDGRRWELIDGDFEVNPAPSTRHQTVSRRLQYELMTAIELLGHGQVFNAPVDVILSDTNVIQPDLCIIKSDRQGIISDRGIEGPPDIIVEILSPSTSTLDRRVKHPLYARFGVGEYWVVEPTGGRIDVHHLDGNHYALTARLTRASILKTPKFPELAVELHKVFRD